MRGNTPVGPQLTHKEENAARIEYDSQDRNILREKIELCVNPLEPDEHGDGLVNIATGQVISHPAINVENAVGLGKTQMGSFKQGLPAGFYDTIHNVVNTMGSLRKHIKIGNSEIVKLTEY